MTGKSGLLILVLGVLGIFSFCLGSLYLGALLYLAIGIVVRLIGFIWFRYAYFRLNGSLQGMNSHFESRAGHVGTFALLSAIVILLWPNFVQMAWATNIKPRLAGK